jgi:hypothetical protein
MANGQGFMIPLNEADWGDGGVRDSWCAAPNAWWTNENIYLANSTWGPTDAGVGDEVTITVGVQGLVDSDGTSARARVAGVQAWACLPTTGPTGTAGVVVPSMQAAGPPVWTAGETIMPASNPSEYHVTAGTPPPFAWIPVGTWTPTASDIVAPNTSTHCCLIANCWGVADATGPVSNPGGNPVGAQIPADLAGIDVCTSSYQGQCNIAIVPATGPPSSPYMARFGFVALNPSLRDPTEVVLEVRPVVQEHLDPPILRALQTGHHGSQALAPSASGVNAMRLRHNEHQQERGLAALLREAEEIVEELVEELTHRSRETSRLRLKLPPKGVHPLLCEIELDPNEPPGSVHVFDITQTDRNGRRGGIRIVTVVVPDE